MRGLARQGVVLAAGLILAAMAVSTPPGRQLDRFVDDAVGRAAPPVASLDRLLAVEIDDASIAALRPMIGDWPYARDVYGPVAAYLVRAGARRVVFDILFTDDRTGDAQFADALCRTRAPILAAVALPNAANAEDRRDPPPGSGITVPADVPALGWTHVLWPAATLTSRGCTRVAVATLVPDEDGVVRRVPLIHRAGVALPSLALASLDDAPVVSAVESGRSVRVGARTWPVDRAGQVEIRLPDARTSFARVPFSRVVAAALGLAPPESVGAVITDRIVLIGVTASLLDNQVQTPAGRLAGLHLLALAHAALRDGLVLAPRRWWIDVLLALAVAIVAGAGARRWPAPWTWLLWTAVAGVLAALAAWGALVVFHQRVALLLALVTAGLACGARALERVRELERAQTTLLVERRAAERASELKDEFLAHVSHELRTPLTAIMGFARLLEDEPGLPPSRRHSAQMIGHSGRQLLDLVNNLLDHARLKAGRITIDAQPCDVRLILRDVTETLSQLAEQKHLALAAVVESGVPRQLVVDGGRLRQIALNIAANAVKFTRRGEVTMRLGWHDDWLSLSVEDTGPGIAPAALGHVFGAFEQVRQPGGPVQGSGLGLTISRQLARLMQGDVTVASTPGVGSTFTVRLPARAAEPPRAAAASLVAEPAAAAPRRILIADDAAEIRQLLGLFVSRLGFEPLYADNGRSAVAVALAEAPDLVLMDVQMPVMSGVGAIRELRQAGYTGPIAALTAAGSAEADEAGFDAVIGKPVSREELQELLVSLLGPLSQA